MGAKDCAQCVCLSVCPLAYLKKPHVQTSPNLPYLLPVAAARSFSDDSAIRYVLPGLWMTSCFNITGHICGAQRSLQPTDISQREAMQRGAELKRFSSAPLYVACRHTQWSLAVEADNALCTGAKCATLYFLCISCEAQNVLNFTHNKRNRWIVSAYLGKLLLTFVDNTYSSDAQAYTFTFHKISDKYAFFLLVESSTCGTAYLILSVLLV